jgi:RimJ/RimL family protein N-acetyltransferase
MQDLGGPTPKEKIPALHTRRLNSVLSKTVWYFTIVPDSATGPVGTIGVWESDWQGAKINEMGWMILPAFQGLGLASKAGQMLLNRARSEQKFKEIHAFPSVANGASNAICRKLGFRLLGEVEVAYNGPAQPSNQWKIEV